ncbi:helix-turn-helix transcriptional regulator [Alicyclobacillus sendaiensis]|uniref:helix-turn-helix transcriptional regulator n=1 Tax=Alicyclobacillus sendaiensis TaxID=192387 RepID=UPI0026F413E6|nr:helix-turn-helix transcriptional regulator [Alicyclobacillus sendaiensis]
MRLDAFGRRLRAFRKLKQMTQADLARALGVSLATIGGIERGTRQPTAHLVRAIASALSVDVEELCGRDWPAKGEDAEAWDEAGDAREGDARAGHAAWDAGLA